MYKSTMQTLHQLRYLLWFIPLFLFFVVCSVFAQTRSVDEEYITEWLVLGPFFPNDLETDFLASVGGEVNIEPQAGDTLRWFTKSKLLSEANTADGKELTWERYATKENIVGLCDAVGYHKNATVYAFCTLQSEEESDVQIHLGSSDAGVAV